MSKHRERKIAGLEVIEVPGDEGGAGIVIFHGLGADGYDLVGLAQSYNETPKPTWFFPHALERIQLAPGYFGRAWFDIDLGRLRSALQNGNHDEIMKSFPKDLEKVRRVGEQLIAELNIPLSKLFLGGFSQGAVLAAEIGLHSFQNSAGLLLFSGTLVNAEAWERLAHQHAGMPFFQSHGHRDPILPFVGAQRLEQALIKGGMKGTLHAFNGGHEIPHSVIVSLNRFLSTHLSPS
jgi:phospholipase/carboxylesterase